MNTKLLKFWAQALCVLALLCLSAYSALAQSGAGTGAISGVVVDASGSVVPDATVLVTNASKGVRRELKSNGDGISVLCGTIAVAGSDSLCSVGLGCNGRPQQVID